MSRIGNQPILIPKGVNVKIDDSEIEITGPKGTLRQALRPELKVVLDKDQRILVSRKQDNRFSRSLHGLTRALITNMITGVTEGFSKILKLVGTGYRAKIEGEELVLSVGFSHPVIVRPSKGVSFKADEKDTITVLGTDKALVGQEAAKIRAIRPPEPYKGKGIRYENEKVRKKLGKAGKVGAAVPGGEGK